ncbi:MAG: hypothetical protein M1833_004013 [Piccolia ochrophora]|nr:MAG: hypothetical protein M1833_004013 [Piccolia ochrophora]
MTDSAPSTTASASNAYKGHCHCGAIKFDVTLDKPVEEQSVVSCSICVRNGYLFLYVPNGQIDFTGKDVATVGTPQTPAPSRFRQWNVEEMTELTRGTAQKYTFAYLKKTKIGHHFCPTCGTSVWAKSVDPDFYPDFTALNVRTFQEVDLEKLTINKYEGKELEPKYEVD